jgi:hypothetical protein
MVNALNLGGAGGLAPFSARAFCPHWGFYPPAFLEIRQKGRNSPQVRALQTPGINVPLKSPDSCSFLIRRNLIAGALHVD